MQIYIKFKSKQTILVTFINFFELKTHLSKPTAEIHLSDIRANKHTLPQFPDFQVFHTDKVCDMLHGISHELQC